MYYSIFYILHNLWLRIVVLIAGNKFTPLVLTNNIHVTYQHYTIQGGPKKWYPFLINITIKLINMNGF